MAKKRYTILVNVLVRVERAKDGRRIPWIKIRGYKGGVITRQARFIDTKPVVKATKHNMRMVGRSIFKAAKEMFTADSSAK